MDRHFTSYRIEERSYVSFIKREIHHKVAVAKFTTKQQGEIDIIVSEITSNLIKHAANGEILYRISSKDDSVPVFEILCIDKGPGIEDPTRMMKDGISTTKTLGQGLGAMERLSNLFQIFTIPKWGTIVYTKVGDNVEVKPLKSGFNVEIKTLCVPKHGEMVCGDGYSVKQSDNFIQILFGDGLGHGPAAAEAVKIASAFFQENKETDPVSIIRQMHEAVRKTRGLVASIATLDRTSNQWNLCGVGNILTRMYSGIEYKNYLSYNGAIGLNIPNSMKSSVFQTERNQHLVMCSDGLQTRWDLNKFPSIFKYDNTVLAAALYKDFARGTDDTSSLIAKVI
jgi:anti-sigma regulatory factor (Ser/Thr protein kinase)